MDITLGGRAVFAATGGRPFDPALPAVVLLHGAGMDHMVWAFQSRYLAHHGRSVLALDLPGHGRSDGPALESVEEMADWLVRVLDALGVAEAAVAGHSMGAIVALTAAARHPARVRALAVLGCAGAMPVHPALLSEAAADRLSAVEMVNGWGHGQDSQRGGHPLAGTWLLGVGHRLLQRASPGVLHRDLVACDAWKNGAAAAAAVECPTLVLSGADDRMTPAKAGRALAAAIPGARYEVLPGTGHMLMTEAPEATLAALKTVL